MASTATVAGRLPFGADISPSGVRFRVWAPERQAVHVVLVDTNDDEQVVRALQRDEEGIFSEDVSDARAGNLYYFQLDDDPQKYPDPASRFQPRGVHGPSQVIDPATFEWHDAHWSGVSLPGQVLYELHIGLFTPEGTWHAAAAKLPSLRDIGVTTVELMPVAAFPGDFGWGYDGVFWFAPTQLYGDPDAFRSFVDHAHQLGMGVILDVVYNHFGPSGNYTGVYSPYYISKKHRTEWGDALNFDGEHCDAVRDLVTSNAAYWIREFHLDGLRLDAIQSIVDESEEHVVASLTRAARAAAGERSILIVGENERQLVHHVLPREEGGYGIDAVWNDDFHHATRLAATGFAEGYYRDYLGSPQELISSVRHGYLYQGQWNARQARFRGTPSRDIGAPHFVTFLQNHDQVANSARGLRIHLLTTPGRHRALTALLLLGPQTPMLFMGQEFGASSPFYYFADHEPDLAALVRKGRFEFLSQFPGIGSLMSESVLPDPVDPNAFAKCKIDWSERSENQPFVELHRELIELRKEDRIFSRQDQNQIEGAVIGPEAFALRWYDDAADDRLAIFNLGRDLAAPPAEPLLAPPPFCRWEILWSSEDPHYGGGGTPEFDATNWQILGHAAVVLRAVND